jgi:hypothetical protein
MCNVSVLTLTATGSARRVCVLLSLCLSLCLSLFLSLSQAGKCERGFQPEVLDNKITCRPTSLAGVTSQKSYL